MSTTSTAPAPGEFTHRQIMTILSGLMIGMFLAALDQTVVSTAIRTIADELHGLDVQAWVTTAYLITSTIATPLYGKLGDIYGRKRLFLFAIAVFIVGSLACSFADTMAQLAAARALQGVGAGGLFSLALAIIGEIVPPRERAKYQGYFVAVFGTSSVLGPVIGGFFAGRDTLMGISGWRWIFLLNVPLGLAALAVVARVVKLRHTRQDHRIDWWGAAALILGLVPLLTVAEQGREWGWDSANSMLCYIVGGSGVVLFVLAEWAMKEEALLPLRMFATKAVGITILGSAVIGMAMFGGMMTLPLYMQIVHGATPMQSGFMMLPMVGGMMTASIMTGQVISRTGIIRPFPVVGSVLIVVAMLSLSTIDADTALWFVMVMMFVLGIGLGCNMQPLILIVQNAVSPREIGVATSSATFFRQIGGTLGVAVFLSLLFNSVGDKIKASLTAAAKTTEFRDAVGMAMADPNLKKDDQAFSLVRAIADPVHHGADLAQVNKDSSVLNRIPDVIAHPFQQGFALSIAHVFWVAGLVAILAVLILALMPKIVLRTQSAMTARESEHPVLDETVDAAAHAGAQASAGHLMDELPGT